MNAALQKAHAHRSERSRLRNQLEHGWLDIHELLFDPPDWLASARVSTWLGYRRWLGPRRVEPVFIALGIPFSRTFEQLSEVEAQTLSRTLAKRYPRCVARREAA